MRSSLAAMKASASSMAAPARSAAERAASASAPRASPDASASYANAPCRLHRKRAASTSAISTFPILPFDSAVVPDYVDIVSHWRAAGRPLAQFDAQIAAIARRHGAGFATRDVGDFMGCGLAVIAIRSRAGSPAVLRDATPLQAVFARHARRNPTCDLDEGFQFELHSWTSRSKGSSS